MENVITTLTIPGYTALVFFLGHIIGLPGDKTKTAQAFGALLVLGILAMFFYPIF